jgi:hypothetical protein
MFAKPVGFRTPCSKGMEVENCLFLVWTNWMDLDLESVRVTNAV